jgi:hypothetical protein
VTSTIGGACHKPRCHTDRVTGGVTDEAWASAAKHYDEGQLSDLVMLIALMNDTNRMAVIVKQRGGDYQPGQSR